VTDKSDRPNPQPGQFDRRELRLALQRLASGYYNRPDVLRIVARKILALESEALPH
jgi:hypothetical protein